MLQCLDLNIKLHLVPRFPPSLWFSLPAPNGRQAPFDSSQSILPSLFCLVLVYLSYSVIRPL